MLDFQRQQLAFIRRIKDPAAPLPAGVDPQRMAVYEELFFNNLQNFINSAFPVLRSLIAPAQWQAICRQFFREQPLHSPYFLHISATFLQWLAHLLPQEPSQQPPQTRLQLPLFAYELAHYEWLELVLATDLAAAPPGWLFVDDSPLFLSPLARLGCYQYQVQHISVDFLPVQPQATFILLYRDPADEVRFIELNALTAALLQLIDAEPGQTLAQYADALQPYLPDGAVAQLIATARPLLQDFAGRGVLCPAEPENPAGNTALPMP